MTYDTVDLAIDARGVATLRLNRPDKHNALSSQMLDELLAVAEAIRADATIRVVVLTGAGKSFCAGGDLAWMQEQMTREPDICDHDARACEAAKLAYMLQALNTLPQPVIGMVQGNALGGGIGMACICDVAIGAEHIKLGLTETRLGLIPATIGPYVLARMGEGRARRVFMSGRVFGAAEAVDLGILAHAVPADDLAAAIEAEVTPYLSCAPGAVAASKALVRSLGPIIDEATIAMTIEALKYRWASDEAKEGIAAFFEKRKADFVS